MSLICDINWLYNKYYLDNPELKRIVWVHSLNVAKKALKINKEKSLGLDPQEIYIAAMLHDIGVVNCNAPGIHAFGELPYLQHGLEGHKILMSNGLQKYARICSCHTGAGISAQDVIEKNLPLPPQDFLPSSLLEKLITYSDKFFSKSQDLSEEKSLEQVQAQMQKFGPGSYSRFMALHRLFS